jgi:Polysaccharide deacetylase
MAGVCIVSFDCESKWGMADHLSLQHERLFKCDNLMKVYGDMLDILCAAEIKATFAFVGALTLDRGEFVSEWLGALKESAQHRVWLSRLILDLSGGNDDGWFIPNLLGLVKESCSGHEIASHGFTHLPLDRADSQAARLEVEGIKYWMKRWGVKIDTFVFPRNLVSRRFDFKEVGVMAYRDRPVGSEITGPKGRLLSLIKEFYPFPSSQRNLVPADDEAPLRIPGNFFLNWRHGARRLVPMGLTAYRLRHALRDASQKDGVVHVWLHPHNLLTGDRQKELFESCMQLIRDEARAGRIVVKTQSEFSRAAFGLSG